MSWRFSRVLAEDCLLAGCLDGGPSAPSRKMNTHRECSCSDKTTEPCHHSRYGTTSTPSMEPRGEDSSTSYLEAFLARLSARRREEGTLPQTFGRKCYGLSESSSRDSCSPKTSLGKQSTLRATTSKRWVTRPEPLPFQRQTWVLTTFGSAIGYLHTPTTKANYCGDSMQKWPSARSFSTVFGRPTPENQEWLMGWPIGWSDSEPLEMGRFLSWLSAHCYPFV